MRYRQLRLDGAAIEYDLRPDGDAVGRLRCSCGWRSRTLSDRSVVNLFTRLSGPVSNHPCPKETPDAQRAQLAG